MALALVRKGSISSSRSPRHRYSNKRARAMRASAATPAAPTPAAQADSSTAPQPPGAIVKAFLASNAWAQTMADIQASIHTQLAEQLGCSLTVQPTKHAPDGVLHVPSLDGATAEFRLATHRTVDGPIRLVCCAH
jgi:hypothetical protein